jgi:hypothetical protein
MAARFELVIRPDNRVVPDARLLVWPPAGDSQTVRASLDPWLTPLGPCPPAAVDLVRVAATALIADRRTPRPQRGLRDFELTVHVTDPASWSAAGGAADVAAELLGFLTGDQWSVQVHPDCAPAPAADRWPGPATPVAPSAGRALLFSGGLDSFCGAILTLTTPGGDAHSGAAGGGDAGTPVFVAHRDSPIVAAAQRRASTWITDALSPAFTLEARWLAQAEPKLELTERSRSLLFASLGVATAAGRDAWRLQVPENGWTSLNPPLRANRGGWLSTRSTHPHTFALLEELLGRLGLAVQVANPHAWQTKGELVRAAVDAAAEAGGRDVAAGIAGTLSCAKLDGHRYKGGNPGLNCGLCVACLVRRAAIRAAGVPDHTAYLVDRLTGDARDALLARRQPDLAAVRVAVAAGVDESLLLAAATLPRDFDVDRALDLWQRGLEELADIDLP